MRGTEDRYQHRRVNRAFGRDDDLEQVRKPAHVGRLSLEKSMEARMEPWKAVVERIRAPRARDRARRRATRPRVDGFQGDDEEKDDRGSGGLPDL